MKDFDLERHDELVEQDSAALRGIAERLGHAMAELFTAEPQPEAEKIGQVAMRPDAVEEASPAVKTHFDALTGAVDAATGADETMQRDDRRLYCPKPDGWTLHVKSGAREYCHLRPPGEDSFHLLIDGELYLKHDTTKMCLNCALRQGILTNDRLFWQTGHRTATARSDAAGDGSGQEESKFLFSEDAAPASDERSQR